MRNIRLYASVMIAVNGDWGDVGGWFTFVCIKSMEIWKLAVLGRNIFSKPDV